MKTSKILAVSFVFMLSVIFLSCNSDPAGPGPGPGSQFTRFPMTTGSKWNYKYESYSYNPRPVTIYNNFDTVRGTGTSIITGDTVLMGLQVKVIKTEFLQGGITFLGFAYYFETDTALFRIASRNFGPFFGPDSPAHNNNQNYTYRLNNKEYNSIAELVYHVDNNFPENTNGDIYYDDPPALLFKYPVILNDPWLYTTDSYTSIYILRQYIGYELVSSPAGTSLCIKLKKILPPNFGDIQMFDYYTNKGPVKSDNLFKDVMVTNKFGEELGLIDIREVKSLTGN